MKYLKVNHCEECPLFGKCSAWENLSSKAKVSITLQPKYNNPYILKDCPLPDLEDEENVLHNN